MRQPPHSSSAPAREEWVPLYDGLSILADMLREELHARGIRCQVQAAGPFLGIIGDGARTPYSVVLVPASLLEVRKDTIDECLALLLPDAILEEPNWNTVEECADGSGEPGS
jgi:hypothetical protein